MAVLDNSYNDYYAVHHLALNYSSGDEECGIELINRFSKFLSEFSKLFSKGYSSVNNIPVRKFITFFNNDANSQHLLYSFISKQVKISSKLSTFRFLKKIMTIQDFNQELILTLLQMAKRYKDNKPSFHNYVNKIFHFTLIKRIESYLTNISINGNIEDVGNNIDIEDEQFNLEFEHKLSDISNELENNNSRLHVKYSSEYDDNNYFNENWIFGNLSTSIFKDLTNSERELIKLSYIDNLTDSQIADRFGLCRATINRKRNKIINTLRERI